MSDGGDILGVDPLKASTAVDVDEWLQQGEQIRARLLEERVRLMARVEEIDAKLAKLVVGRATEAAPQAEPSVRPHNGGASRTNGTPTLSGARVHVSQGASAPFLVAAILSAHPQGLLASEIVSEAQSIQPKIDPRNIYSALQRSTYVSKNGTPRKYRYFLSAAGKEYVGKD